MKRANNKTLKVSREVVRHLDAERLEQVRGGGIVSVYMTCSTDGDVPDPGPRVVKQTQARSCPPSCGPSSCIP